MSDGCHSFFLIVIRTIIMVFMLLQSSIVVPSAWCVHHTIQRYIPRSSQRCNEIRGMNTATPNMDWRNSWRLVQRILNELETPQNSLTLTKEGKLQINTDPSCWTIRLVCRQVMTLSRTHFLYLELFELERIFNVFPWRNF